MAGGGFRRRFSGRIAGVGSTSGVRVVVGHWFETPYGEFGDAMVETAEGQGQVEMAAGETHGGLQISRDRGGWGAGRSGRR